MWRIKAASDLPLSQFEQRREDERRPPALPFVWFQLKLHHPAGSTTGDDTVWVNMAAGVAEV